MLSTFATDGDENDDDDVKNLEKLLLFPPPGPTRFCLHRFEEEEDGEEEEARQTAVVVVKVALLLLMVFYWRIPTERASEKKNGRKATDLTGAKTQKNSRQKLQSLSLFLSERMHFGLHVSHFLDLSRKIAFVLLSCVKTVEKDERASHASKTLH